MTIHHPATHVTTLLRIEGLAIGLASSVAYAQSGGGWMVYAALLLTPDLFMIGYLAGPRVGAALYNLGHTYAGPLVLAGVGTAAQTQVLLLIALIWGAHIGFDRAMGFGLKHRRGFTHTHLSSA